MSYEEKLFNIFYSDLMISFLCNIKTGIYKHQFLNATYNNEVHS